MYYYYRARNKVTGHWGTISNEPNISHIGIGHRVKVLEIDDPPKKMSKELEEDLLLKKNWEIISNYYTVTRGENGGLIKKRINAEEVPEEEIENDIISGIKFDCPYDVELFIHNTKNKKGVDDGQAG